jgi:hypothetical protein
MKMFRCLFLILLLTAVLLSAGERDAAQVSGSPRPLPVASNSFNSLKRTQSEGWVGLNGYCAGPSFRMALLEIHLPAQKILCTLREGEIVAGVELLAIHAERGTVTICRGGLTSEIGFGPLANRSLVSWPAEHAPETEAQQDVSHGEYHKTRARLERERDEVQNADPE